MPSSKATLHPFLSTNPHPRQLLTLKASFEFFELRASHLLHRHSYNLSHSSQLWEESLISSLLRISQELFTGCIFQNGFVDLSHPTLSSFKVT
jgi:hypothetical protein